MNYNARFTVLIEGAVWGVENVEINDVETKEEAFEMALQKEKDSVMVKDNYC